MKKLILLLLFVPLLASATGSGGLPSRPQFQSGQILGGGLIDEGGGVNCVTTVPDPLCSALIVKAANDPMATSNAKISGNLHVRNTAHRASVVIDGNATSAAGLFFAKNGAPRWSIVTSGAEGGTATGSDLIFKGYLNNGGDTGSWLTITRLDGTITHGKQCASGYTRVGVGFCMATGAPFQADNGLTACTQTTAVTGVTDAKAILARVTVSATANNAVAARQSTKTIFGPTDTTCATALDTVQAHGYEFAATVNPTTILQVTNHTIIRTSTTGRFYVTGVAAAAGSVLTIDVLGYYD